MSDWTMNDYPKTVSSIMVFVLDRGESALHKRDRSRIRYASKT
jgi:hypothetical protein